MASELLADRAVHFRPVEENHRLDVEEEHQHHDARKARISGAVIGEARELPLESQQERADLAVSMLRQIDFRVIAEQYTTIFQATHSFCYRRSRHANRLTNLPER